MTKVGAMDVGEAVRASRTTALLFPESLAVLRVDGPDRASWLNGLVTCDVTKLTPAAAMYGLIVEKKGKILSDLVLVSHLDAVTNLTSLFLGVPRSRVDVVFEILDHHLIMENCELQRAPTSMFLAWGPEARTLAASSCAQVFSGASFPVADLDRSGHGRAAILVPDAYVDAFLKEHAGHVASQADVTEARVAAGVPAFGIDFGTDHYPQEATLERIAVSFDKGCYMGQEVVFMLQNRGRPKRRLVKLALEAPVVVGADVLGPDSQPYGSVTSVATVEGKPWAIAMVKSKAADGSTVRVAEVSAEVVPLR